MERTYTLQEILDYRGVETPCKECEGLGVSFPKSTSGCHGNIYRKGKCLRCGGSGDENNRWVATATCPCGKLAPVGARATISQSKS